MEDFIVKYRPTRLEDFLGNDSLKNTLQDIIKSGRIPRALVIDGVYGIGKTTLALILGRMILQTGFSLASKPYELGPADYDYEHIKKFIRSIQSTMDSVTVIFMDEAHRITPTTQELLLKPLENYRNFHIIFATPEIHKLDPGIISRGQVLTLEPPLMLVLKENLAVIAVKEKIEIYDDALEYLIIQSGCIPRECLKNLGSLCGYGKPITIEVVRSRISSNVDAKYAIEQ